MHQPRARRRPSGLETTIGPPFESAPEILSEDDRIAEAFGRVVPAALQP
jgi:hypothetical protein